MYSKQMNPFQTLKGFKDLLPEETSQWEAIFSLAKTTFDLYGFSMIETPIMEPTELFTRSIGTGTDIIEKEMYTFDDYGKKVSLRPEGTACAVRAYLEHPVLSQRTLAKIYYIGPMFRRERPQAGRLRQFHQIGAEIIGEGCPQQEVELLSFLFHFFEHLHLSDLTLELNSIGCPLCRPAYKEKLQTFLADKLPILCEDCGKRFQVNPLRILDCKKETCKSATKNAPAPKDCLCIECDEHFQAVQKGLDRVGIVYQINPRLVRGLDYYTKTAFEITTTKLGAQNTVAAGGRYDGLVQMLGGPKTSAIGFAIGVERLASLISLVEAAHTSPLPLFMAPLGTAASMMLLPILCSLRKNKIKSEMGNAKHGLKSQMKHADKLSAQYVLIVGDAEIQTGKGILRNMATHEQEEIDLTHLMESLSVRITQEER